MSAIQLSCVTGGPRVIVLCIRQPLSLVSLMSIDMDKLTTIIVNLAICGITVPRILLTSCKGVKEQWER
jgi:hypothetical protein